VTVPEPPSPGPDDTPDVAMEKLKAQLEKTKADLEEANRTVKTQDETIATIEQEYDGKTKGLQQDKKDLEEHMVSIVVQQVREAKAKERVAVAEECEAEVSNPMLGIEDASKTGALGQIQVTSLVQEPLDEFTRDTPPGVSHVRRILHPDLGV
jgi:hypothetical protein